MNITSCFTSFRLYKTPARAAIIFCALTIFIGQADAQEKRSGSTPKSSTLTTQKISQAAPLASSTQASSTQAQREKTTSTTTATTTQENITVATNTLPILPVAASGTEATTTPYHYGNSDFIPQSKLLTTTILGGAAFVLGSALLIFSRYLSRQLKKNMRRRKESTSRLSSYDEEQYQKYMWTSQLTGTILLFAALGIFGGTVYVGQIRANHPIVFSKEGMLNELWRDYKKHMFDPASGRTIDRERGNITTSEGQSYTMLRAVWMDDKETFDVSYTWTKEHLQRPDGLFSWLYGQLPNGTLGVMTNQGGQNTASDANSDIALALIFAYSRWGDDMYLEEARNILDNMWEQEVVAINGKYYLAANNLEKSLSKQTVLLNPSYFSPYAYRIFATFDTTHPWTELVDTSYEVINKSMDMAQVSTSTAKTVLPPNWVLIDQSTGELRAAPDSNYGFDALRIPWRLAIDLEWFGEERAKETLQAFEFLGEEWAESGTLASVYAYDGTRIDSGETPAFYGGAIGYFKAIEPSKGRELYKNKLEILYRPDHVGWRESMGYYDDNWAWFGMALHNGVLTNLTTAIAKSEASRQ